MNYSVRSRIETTIPILRCGAAVWLFAFPNAALGDSTLDIETGALGFTRIDVQIPNTGQADRFDLLDLTGDGPEPYLRLKFSHHWDERHSVTALYAPVRVNGTGTFQSDVNFAGETFVAGTPVRASYQFNTYRVGYRYTWRETDRWRLRIGGSVLIRDANIRLNRMAASLTIPTWASYLCWLLKRPVSGLPNGPPNSTWKALALPRAGPSTPA